MSISTSTVIVAHHWAVAVFFILAISLCFIMLCAGWLLGGRSNTVYKHIPFESGINSTGSTSLRLSAKFYLIAIFFVIFDTETVYLLAWSISIRETGLIGLIEAVIFIIVLLTSLLYLVRIGALNWIASHSRYKKNN